MLSARRRALAATALAVAALLLAGCAAGPLDPSEPEEIVLRAARLAGFDGTTAGRDGDVAYAWLELPGVDSAADVEIAWQTAFASLAAAYPRADAYRVQVSVADAPVLQIAAPGPETRAAADADDADALRASAAFTYLAEDAPAEPPSDAVVAGRDASEAYLDSKNRAAGLLGEGSGGSALKIARLTTEAQRMRSAVPGKPAPPAGGAAEAYAERILESLDGAATGEEAILARIDALSASDPADVRAQVAELRTIAAVVEAVVAPQAYGDLLAAAHEVAVAVRESELEPGAPSDAVLVAAGDNRAPVSARSVESFEPEPALDVTPEATGDSIVAQALIASEGVWVDTTGAPKRLAEQDWSAYRRADSTLFWLGTVDEDLALADQSLDGWAFSRLQVAVVDANNVGQLLGVIRLPGLPVQGGD